jgi:hypothetical protein
MTTNQEITSQNTSNELVSINPSSTRGSQEVTVATRGVSVSTGGSQGVSVATPGVSVATPGVSVATPGVSVATRGVSVSTGGTQGTCVATGGSQGTCVATKMVQKKGKSKEKPNFELFYSDPDLFFSQTQNLQHYEKALFGFCASRKSLRHALIALSHSVAGNLSNLSAKNNQISLSDSDKELTDDSLFNSFESINIEIKNIILSLISEHQTADSGFLSLRELTTQPSLSEPSGVLRPSLSETLEKPEPLEKSTFWSITLYDFVEMLVKSTKEPDERLYTLAIRFYCNHGYMMLDHRPLEFRPCEKGLKKAKTLYNELVKAGITPHSRTFMPFLQRCESIQDLNEWHNVVQKDLSSVPSIDFYEAFFTTFFKVCKKETQDFNKAFEIYRKFYPYITPILARLFTTNLINRKDLKILRDGLVYVCFEKDNDNLIRSPIHKLELVDISYDSKCKLANILMTSTDLTSSTNFTAIRTFEAFVQRYEISWDIVVDGANVGLYNNSESFQYDRIFSILKWARARNYRVLVILHNKRKDSRLDDFISRDPDNFNIYYTPSHYNDDHFALYAALTRDSFILSNDEFKDHTNVLRLPHIFQAEIGSANEAYDKKFLEWRTSHQIFFSFDTRAKDTRFMKGSLSLEPFELYMPSKFSRIIQIKPGTQSSLIFAPVYDLDKNPPHYLENMDKIEGWVIFESL